MAIACESVRRIVARIGFLTPAGVICRGSAVRPLFQGNVGGMRAWLGGPRDRAQYGPGEYGSR